MPPSDQSPDAAYRLPRDVEPLTYRLTFEPDLDRASFVGTAEINLVVHQSSERMVVNAVDLVIEVPELRLADGSVMPATTVEYDEEAERATFVFIEAPPPGPATLTMGFSGLLNDKLLGFYRSTFTDPEGVTRTIATTQMESIYARWAFPCWDEPDRKAVFEVTLIVAGDLPAYSNSPIVEETPLDDGRRRVRFAPTIKMSSYLVAMIVGPLDATDPLDVDGVALRVVYPPGKAYLTDYALEIGAFALRFYTDYFGIPYPAEKLDLVAIPDFAMGAMENLGCVTFRETALLVDPASASRVELERVVDVVAHELAHMWFGDLVTMGWWEGIWLNEAFATFMETLCCDAFRPSWQRWVSFGIEREMALAVDGLHSTRPIEYPVGPPSEVDGMFDVLTYQKGSSVLRMLEQHLGAEVFRDGVRRYLNDHLYANTVTSDLWDAIESVSGQPVRAVMDSWILQGGHPLVSLSGDTLSQRPFAYQSASAVTGKGGAVGQGGTGTSESAIGGPWEIPVSLRRLGSEGGGVARMLLGASPLDATAGAAALDGNGPLVVNAGGWGVYRTAYDSEQTAHLASRLDQLEPLEKADLFADTWAAVLADAVPASDFFTLAAQLGLEEEPTIWGTVAGALNLCWRAAPAPDRDRIAMVVRALLGPRATELGWDRRDGDSERTPQLRSLLLATVGTIGNDAAIRGEAARRFDSAQSASGREPAGAGKSNPEPAGTGKSGAGLDPNIASAILEIVADQLRPGDFDAMLASYRKAGTPQEELRSLTALAQFPDVDLALRTFDLALSEVRTQNAPFLLVPLVANRVAGAAAWERMKAEWTTLIERFPESSHCRMIAGIRTLFEDQVVAEDVRGFLAAHPLPTGQRTVAQSIERLGINQAFAAREHQRIADTLEHVIGTAHR